jgi:hypothetical protein
MAKTNSLTSHHGESHAFPADKMIPKETLKKYGENKIRSWFKRFYMRKNKMFLKNKLREEVNEEIEKI